MNVRKVNAQSLIEILERQPKNVIAFVFKDDNCFHEFDFNKHTGFDLKNMKKVKLEIGRKQKVETGVKWYAPIGFYLSIVPRSGISFHTPIVLANAPATIEASYRGDISLLLKPDSDYLLADMVVSYNYKGIEVNTTNVIVPQYTRLAQCIIYKTALAENHLSPYIYYCIDEPLYNVWEEVAESVRGANGFGSTGVK